ncbi:hypothetical protein [Paraglaciecola aestuariivivens]
MKNDILNTKKLGYKFYFQDGDNQIACFGNYFTGKEEVYFNDELVSSKRNQSVISKHSFEIAGEKYQIVYEMQNILSGRLECSFYKNKHLIEQQQQSSIALLKDPKKALVFVGACFLVGSLTGYILIFLLSAIWGV